MYDFPHPLPLPMLVIVYLFNYRLPGECCLVVLYFPNDDIFSSFYCPFVDFDFLEDFAEEFSGTRRWLSLPRRPVPRKTAPSNLPAFQRSKFGFLAGFFYFGKQPAHFAAS